MILKKAFQPIDNSPLIVFRIFFGLLIIAESLVATLTGWVKINFIDTTVPLPHIGMDFLVPLPGNGMYFYYGLMGLSGLLIAIGYRYRFSVGLFTVLWAGVYFMQKASYNNHYYLLLLVGLIMFFLPAHRYASLDVKFHPETKRLSMPQWCSWVMIGQMMLVYFFATVAKFYPDWLNGTFTGLLFSNLHDFPLLGGVFTEKWFHLFIAYSGILFDGLIIPALLWSKTRTLAFIASLLFHLFNSVTLEIGIFPYFALSFVLFFYPTSQVKALFFKQKPDLTANEPENFDYRTSLTYFFIPLFVFQLFMPIRHWFIKGDVLWTEEGHRLSWRMMLREKSGITRFNVIHAETGKELPYDIAEKLTKKQLALVTSKPDGIWQMAQYIKKEFAQQGIPVKIFVDSQLSVNRHPYRRFIDPKVDFAQAEWDYFFHNDWILLYDKDGNIQPK